MAALVRSVAASEADAIAASLIDEFGSIGAILSASPERLERLLGGEAELVALMGDIRRAMIHVLVQDVRRGPVISNSKSLSDYLVMQIAYSATEQVRVLYLDTDNHLLRDELASTGDLRETVIYPREIMRRVLELGASGIVVAHNHPSGNLQPSEADIAMTKRLAEVARTMDVRLHDHVIVGRGGCFSFRAQGLL